MCSDCFDHFDDGRFIREASNKNPQSAAAGSARMSPSQSLYKDVKGGAVMPEILRLMKQKNLTKKRTELDQGCGFALAPEDQGQRNRAGIEPGKSKGKKTFGCQRPETAASTFFFFPRRHPNNVPSQFWSIFTKEMWKSVCCLELNI